MMSLAELFSLLGGGSPLVLSLLGGSVCALFNMAGATPILLLKQVPEKMLNTCLGFSAGIMLGASFTSLIVPGTRIGGAVPVLVGIVLGAIMVTLADRLLPHMHLTIEHDGPNSSIIRGAWLFVIAITIHNMPEGLAVGVGFGSGNLEAAILLMLAIGLQNVPEGLSVGFSLLATRNYSRRSAYLISVMSGFVEPPLALLGALAVSIAHSILPCAMGFAAGAMLFVISDEIIPETHRKGHKRVASYGLIAGLITILSLDLML
ncbi:MAG: ZIP family metal transporter [archaeon]